MMRKAVVGSTLLVTLGFGALLASRGCLYGTGDETPGAATASADSQNTTEVSNAARSEPGTQTASALTTNGMVPATPNVPDGAREQPRRMPPNHGNCIPECPPDLSNQAADPALPSTR